MSKVLSPRAVQDMQTLFSTGAVGGLPDKELVACFAGTRGKEAEIAFATLVERHGPMVYDVCRAVLRDRHDAQDAFQATFLVLALRAGRIRRGEAVGSWLFGVARRVSCKARTAAARRRARERRAASPEPGTVAQPQPPDDLAILHDELKRLPAAYRSAIVLHHLEGRSYEQAAAALDCPVGTLKSRLARGRDRLRRRLIRRGIASAVALTLVQQVRSASILPPTLPLTTAGAASAAAIELAHSLVRSMNMTRLVTLCGLALVSLAATGAAVFGFRDPDPLPPPQAVPAPVKPDEKETRDFHLRVVDTKGKPVPDVPIRVFDDKPDRIAARTDGDGRAAVAFDALARMVQFLARRDENELGWAGWWKGQLGPDGTADDPIALTLLPLNHEVAGSVVDTVGKPISGVRVQVSGLLHPPNERVAYHGWRGKTSPLGSTVTDEEGLYKLRLPVGSNAHLTAYHPFYVGSDNGCKEATRELGPWTLKPGGRIVGFVVDGKTSNPVPHAKVYAQLLDHSGEILGGGYASAEADETGRFAMGSMAPGVYNLILNGNSTQAAAAVEGVRVNVGEDSCADLTAVTPRLLHGTAVDFATGEPLVGVDVYYYSASHPRSAAACESTTSDRQGKFVCPVPPGDVHVYLGLQKYVGNVGFARDVTVPAEGEVPIVLLKGGGPPDESRRRERVYPCTGVVRRSKIAEISGAGGTHTLRGRVLDRDGRPVAGVRIVYNPPIPAPAPPPPALLEALPAPRVNVVPSAFRMLCTDREGVFLLDNLPDKPIQLDLRKSEAYTSTVPADALEVEFTLSPAD